MREGIKPLIERMRPNHYYIFVAKEGLDKKKSHEVTIIMEKLLAKVGALI